jgi:hypothetical protein
MCALALLSKLFSFCVVSFLVYSHIRKQKLNKIISHSTKSIFKIIIKYKTMEDEYMSIEGMGFLIKPDILVTNYHVVEKLYDSNVIYTGSYIIDQNGNEHEGDVICKDAHNDLCFIQMRKTYDDFIDLNSKQQYSIFRILSFRIPVFVIKYITNTKIINDNIKIEVENIKIAYGSTIPSNSINVTGAYEKMSKNKSLLLSNMETGGGFSGSPLIDGSGKLIGIHVGSCTEFKTSAAIATSIIIENLRNYNNAHDNWARRIVTLPDGRIITGSDDNTRKVRNMNNHK